jgi:hypothetical protein
MIGKQIGFATKTGHSLSGGRGNRSLLSDPFRSFRGIAVKAGLGRTIRQNSTPHAAKKQPFFLNRQETLPLVSIRGQGLINIS